MCKLCDAIEIKTGEQLNKSCMMPDGSFPIINGGIDVSGYTNQYNTEAKTITISQGGASAGYVNWVNSKFWAGAHCYIVTPKKGYNKRFLYHFIKFKEYDFMNSKQGAGIPGLNRTVVLKTEMPKADEAKQQQIADTLDKFTSMIENIDEEIELRQKQYEKYRNKLLSFSEDDESVEWKELGEIGEVVRGNGLQKKDFSDNGIGCIHYGQIYTKLGFSIDKPLTYVPVELAETLTKVEPGNLVIACTSENIEDVCKSVLWLGNETIVTGAHASVFKHKANPKFIAYSFMTSHFFLRKRNMLMVQR